MTLCMPKTAKHGLILTCRSYAAVTRELHRLQLAKIPLMRSSHVQVYISLASFSCSQATDGSCGCKQGDFLGGVGGNLCIYQPEPGVKIPTASPSRFLRAPFTGCEYVTGRYCPPGFNGGDAGASCVAIAGICLRGLLPIPYLYSM